VRRHCVGIVFGLLSCADRLLKGRFAARFLVRHFRSAARIVFRQSADGVGGLRFQPEGTQWAARLIVYCAFGYLGMMLAMRSNRDEFSLIIPYVRFARETTQHEPLVVDTA
jgi:hypothetical protein